jgi:hypothetical protein
MTVTSLINWTLEKAQHLKSTQHEASDPYSGPSLGWLLSVVEPESVVPTKSGDQVARIASSPSILIPPEELVAPPSNEAVAPRPNELSDLAAVVPAISSLSEEKEVQQSVLMTAILKPSIRTAPTDRDRGIAFRWVLRDIKSNRLQWSPVSPEDLRTLIELDLIEMCENTPVLTKAGIAAIT